MKISPRGARRLGQDADLVFQLPDPRLLRLVARSVLLTVAIVSFPWLRTALLAAAPSPTVVTAGDIGSRWIEDPFFLPMLLRDLRRQGLLRPGDRAIFLGNPSPRLPVLRQNHVEPIPEYRKPLIADRTVDFILAGEGFGDSSFGFIDRVLRIGGVTAVRLGSGPLPSFHLPSNYRIVYIRRFGSTVVGIKKIAHSDNADEPVSGRIDRKLLAVLAARRAALEGLELPLLEPPMGDDAEPSTPTRYLPDLIDEPLSVYPRRVFVDVVRQGKAGSVAWFENEYPKGGREWEIKRVVEAGGLVEWLVSNVREKDFVVMKAEAGVVENVLQGGVIGLVDEVFLECENQWGKGSRSRRPYWECLALYGRIRDEGVAVHQWWG